MGIIESITFKRSKFEPLYNDLLKGKSFLLFGPRQTGKSTLLESIFSRLPQNRTLRYYLQLPSVREKIELDPESLIREVEAISHSNPVYLFIDEIQKVPKVFDVLQFLLDKKKIVLAATGSSARKLKHAGMNWLPGRIHRDYLFPLTWEEAGLLSNPARIQEACLFGGLPAIWANPDPIQRERELSSYTHLYLEEEIRLEAVVRNVPRFSKFLQLAALESGTAPNFSKIGGQVGLSHTSIREYFQILEDTLLVHRLDAFGKRRDAVLRSPKFLFFDLGVRNSAAQIGHSQGIITLQEGILFEHFVILELIARFKSEARFYFYRTKQGIEVDLIMEKKNKIIPIEIKSTRRPSAKDFQGLDHFYKKYQSKGGLLVCQVDQVQKFGNSSAVPWFQMLEFLE